MLFRQNGIARGHLQDGGTGRNPDAKRSRQTCPGPDSAMEEEYHSREGYVLETVKGVVVGGLGRLIFGQGEGDSFASWLFAGEQSA